MRRLSSISQCPSSRAAATAWSSPRMVSRMITIRRSSGETPARRKRDELCDRIVFAIAGAMREGDQRRTPDVDLAILGQIAHRPDRKIDRAIDLAEPGAAVAGPRVVDDGEKPQRGRRHAAFAVAVAKRQLHPFVVELALDAAAIFPAARPRTAARRTARTARRIGRPIPTRPASISVPAGGPRAGPNQTMPNASMTARHACERPKIPI